MLRRPCAYYGLSRFNCLDSLGQFGQVLRYFILQAFGKKLKVWYTDSESSITLGKVPRA